MQRTDLSNLRTLPPKNRVEALVDGIFSVAMTLLVLDIKLPEGVQFSSNQDLLQHFASVEISFGIYAVSFWVLAMFWVAHHYQFKFVERVDRSLLWINMMFLLFITLVPFTTSLAASHKTLELAVALYAGNLLLLEITLMLHLRRMRLDRGITSPEFTPEVRGRIGRRLAMFCVIPLLAIVVAMFSATWGLRVFYLLAAMHFVAPYLERVADREARVAARGESNSASSE